MGGVSDGFFGRGGADEGYYKSDDDFEPGRPSQAHFGDKDNNPEFLIPGRFDQYKQCMLEAAMTKVEQNLKEKLKRFTLEFSQDFTYGSTLPVYDFSKDCVLVNKEITRHKKKRIRHVFATSDLYPEELEFKIFDIMKRQKHLHWRINFTYHEYEIYTGDKTFQGRDFVGLGALLVKWG